MIIKKYLCITKKGQTRMTQTSPNLGGSEIAVYLNIEIPDAFFTRPKLEAKITVPSGALPSSSVTATVASDLEKLVKETMGLDLVVSVVEPPEKNSLEILLTDKTE